MNDVEKKELTEKMNQKNRELLLNHDGLSSLFIYNLENFAYRYIGTSVNQDIKCQTEGNRFRVESIEPNILEALKWKNPELKKRLIDLCKKYPGNESKKIQIQLLIETQLINKKKVNCLARFIWHLPTGDKEIGLEKSQEFSFDDPIELRNKHAALLDEVCEIF